MMKKEYRIALIIDARHRYGRATLRGILSCPRHPYHMVLELFTSLTMEPLENGRFDGLIVHLTTPNEFGPNLGSSRIPMVNVGNPVDDRHPTLPRVGVDDDAVGVMAARFFLQRGFQSFGFSHCRNFPFSIARYRGFARTIQTAGLPTPSLDAEPADWVDMMKVTTFEAQRQWLLSLPKPAAILAANDGVGVQLLRSCAQASVRVSEDVAVMGVDNDEFINLMSEQSLSSVEVPGEEIGVQAMMLLKELLAGGQAPEKPLLLAPVQVVERHSTDGLASADASVTAALRYIRDHLSESIGVDHIARGMMMSRRQLETRFRATLNRSPAEEIRRARLTQAGRMLIETNLPIAMIAQHVGLNGPDQLVVAFKHEYDMTPSEYRKKHRVGLT
jgi:LacI family transcriptional regulator